MARPLSPQRTHGTLRLDRGSRPAPHMNCASLSLVHQGVASQPTYRVRALPRLRLAPDEVQVWWLSTDAEQRDLAAFAAVLDPAEQVRAARFVFLRDRARFILAHGALRHLLAAYVDRPAGALHFSAGAHGKPALAEPDPAFNLSHAGDIVLIGVAPNRRHLGVDVEPHRSVHEMTELVGNCFSATEATAWRRLPASQREAAFFRAWTRKEAFIKATGEGLSRPLASFTVSIDDTPAIRTPNLPHWSLHQLDISRHAAAALAIDHPRPRISLAQLDF
jgi:4'-phosphopantetheinyl transferase